MPDGHTMGWFSGRHSMRTTLGFATSGMPVLVSSRPIRPLISEPDPRSGGVDMSDSCLRGESPIGVVSKSSDFMALFLSNYDSRHAVRTTAGIFAMGSKPTGITRHRRPNASAHMPVVSLSEPFFRPSRQMPALPRMHWHAGLNDKNHAAKLL